MWDPRRLLARRFVCVSSLSQNRDCYYHVTPKALRAGDSYGYGCVDPCFSQGVVTDVG